MSKMASQITSLMIVYSTVYSGADQRKTQSSASLAFVRGIRRWPVNSPYKGPVTRKMFPFDDVIMVADRQSEATSATPLEISFTHTHLSGQTVSKFLAQSTAVILPCYVQNFKTIWQLKWIAMDEGDVMRAYLAIYTQNLCQRQLIIHEVCVLDLNQVGGSRRSTYATKTRCATWFSIAVRRSTYKANGIPDVTKLC